MSVPFIQGLIVDSDAGGNVIVNSFDKLCPAIKKNDLVPISRQRHFERYPAACPPAARIVHAA